VASITISLVVTNVADVLECYDQLKVYRSPTGENGTFVEITSAPTRIPLSATQTLYTYKDLTGTASDYYASTYFNSTTSDESTLSPPVQGDAGSALSVISIDELKSRYLIGVPSSYKGIPFPDSTYVFHIQSAVAWVEQQLDLPILPKVFTDAIPESGDFIQQDYYKWVRMQLDEFPILSVERIIMQLSENGTAPTFTFDPSWFRIQKFSGQVHIVPTSGSGLIYLGAAPYVPPLSMYGWTEFIPEAFRISYTAGFDKVPDNIIDMIGKVAAIGIMHMAGDIVNGAGVGERQLQIDGVMSRLKTTQSATSAGYTPRINGYWKEIMRDIPVIRMYWKGIGAEAG